MELKLWLMFSKTFCDIYKEGVGSRILIRPQHFFLTPTDFSLASPALANVAGITTVWGG